MKTEAKITIKEIRAALSTDVAIGKMSQETADRVEWILGLDYKEKRHTDRKDMDCFLEDLWELFAKYDAEFHFEGQYRGYIHVNSLACRLCFGEVSPFNSDFIAFLPKMWKRSQIVSKLKFTPTTNVDDIKPIFDAVRKVNPKSSCDHVTDKEFNEMIKPYK
jgi:hypothetical protein